MELSKLLFEYKNKDRKIDIVSGDVTLGMAGPAGLYVSSVRPSSASGKPAKISNAALVVECLLRKKLNAIQLENLIYTEFEDCEGHLYKAICDGTEICFSVKPPIEYRVVPLVLYWLSCSEASLSTESFLKVLWSLTGNDLYRFCDDVYYESKSVLPNELVYNTSFYDEQIKQAVRTGNYSTITVLDHFIVSELTKEYPLSVLDGISVPSEQETESTDNEKMQECRIGSYFLNHQWNTEQQKYIPDLSTLDGFVPNEAFYTMVDLVHHSLTQVEKRLDEGDCGIKAIGEDYVNCMFVGRPGTGKTTIADALGAAFNMPVRVVVNSKNTEEDSMQGMTKVQEGGFKFVETPFLDVYKNGGILLLEEFNLADPGVMMGALGQAIEKPFILLEDGYREVRRHPLCVVIATMNTGTQGSRSPSEALTSRMPDVFLLDDPEKNQFIQILQNRSGQPKEKCQKVYKAYRKVIDYLESPTVNQEDVALSITLRHCLAALKLMSIGRHFKQALYNTLIGTIAIKDMKLAKDVNDNVIQHLPD